MTLLLNLLKALAFQPGSLRALAQRRALVPAFLSLAIGFIAFVLARSSGTQETFPDLREQVSAIVFFLDTHLLQMMLFLSLVYVPVIVVLSNAFAGDGLGFSISRPEYQGHLSGLLPLWGALFLIGAPLVPVFLTVGIFELSLGELWLMLATVVYSVWAIKELDYLPVAAALGVFVLSLLSLPVLFVLTNFLVAVPFFLALPLLFVFLQRLRELLAARSLLQGFRRHLHTLTSNPRDADAHFQLGLLHFRRGHTDAALGYFEQAVTIDPSDADYHYYMGRIHEARGQWAQAADQYETTYRLNPEYGVGDIFREVGKAYLHTDRLEKALEFLAFFLERRSSDPEGRYWLAVALQRAGRKDEMRMHLNAVLDQARSGPRFYRRTNREWIYRSRILLRGTLP